MADSPQVNPLDMKEINKTAPKPDIIKKHKRESREAFLKRGKERGILRKCCSCGFRRDFHKVACPLCGSGEFFQIQGDKPDTSKDSVKEGEAPPTPDVPIHDEESLKANKPVASDDGNYAFTPNPDFDPAEEPASLGKPKPVTKPLEEHGDDELRELAKSHGVNIGNTKLRETIISKIETKLNSED